MEQVAIADTARYLLLYISCSFSYLSDFFVFLSQIVKLQSDDRLNSGIISDAVPA